MLRLPTATVLEPLASMWTNVCPTSANSPATMCARPPPANTSTTERSTSTRRCTDCSPLRIVNGVPRHHHHRTISWTPGPQLGQFVLEFSTTAPNEPTNLLRIAQPQGSLLAGGVVPGGCRVAGAVQRRTWTCDAALERPAGGVATRRGCFLLRCFVN
eukprot:SAG31_NODE_4317_length_3363_cov_1.982230_1_plen_158_part_00